MILPIFLAIAILAFYLVAIFSLSGSISEKEERQFDFDEEEIEAFKKEIIKEIMQESTKKVVKKVAKKVAKSSKKK